MKASAASTGRISCDVAQALGDVDQVERAGHEVEQADADDDEGRADGAHDQVLVGRQRARGGRARSRSARRSTARRSSRKTKMLKASPVIVMPSSPVRQRAEHGVEQVMLFARGLRPRRCGGVGHHRPPPQGDTSTSTKAESASTRYSMPQGGGPAAHVIGDRAVVCDLLRQQQGDQQRDPGDGQHQPVGDAAAARQHHQGRGNQRQDDLQGGEMRGNHWTAIPPSPFPRKGVTIVRGLRPLHAVRLRRPWDGPAGGDHSFSRSSLSSSAESRLPRWCRRLRGCAPPAPGRAPASPRRRRWR